MCDGGGKCILDLLEKKNFGFFASHFAEINAKKLLLTEADRASISVSWNTKGGGLS